MATLSDAQKAQLRKELSKGEEVTWDRGTADLASQAIEDWFESNRASISTAINTATSPITLSAALKTKLVKFYLRQKFTRGG